MRITIQTAYIENKDLNGIFLRFPVLFGRQFLDVYIWRTVRGLRRNTFFRADDYLGAYIPYPYRKPQSGLFGEVHLLKRLVGAGYVAHELQHFLYDWIKAKPKEPQNETIALLAGDITRDFWKRYYAKSKFSYSHYITRK